MTNKNPSPENEPPAAAGECPTARPPEAELKKAALDAAKEQAKEIGGFADSGLPEPTRYGDWEVKGRCSDF